MDKNTNRENMREKYGFFGKTGIFLCTVIMLALMFTGCGPVSDESEGSESHAGTETVSSEEANTATVFAMDTVMDLTVYGADDALMKTAQDRITELEGLFSVTAEGSEIAKLNSNGTAELSEDTTTLLQKALEMCSSTRGKLDISVYPVVKAWGFTTGEYRVPSDSEINELLNYVDWQKIVLKMYDDGTGGADLMENMQIDLGSVAKGYTGDELIKLFKSQGVTSALLNLGGNVQVIGSKPDGSAWRIAVQDPENPDDYVGVINARDKAVITSGGYERYFEQDGETYWHIIDPSTGKPGKSGIISATIVGDEGVICDALSTSLFLMGLGEASDYWRENKNFDAVLIDEDGNIYVTEGLKDDFSLMEAHSDKNVTVIE